MKFKEFYYFHIKGRLSVFLCRARHLYFCKHKIIYLNSGSSCTTYAMGDKVDLDKLFKVSEISEIKKVTIIGVWLWRLKIKTKSTYLAK